MKRVAISYDMYKARYYRGQEDFKSEGEVTIDLPDDAADELIKDTSGRVDSGNEIANPAVESWLDMLARLQGYHHAEIGSAVEAPEIGYHFFGLEQMKIKKILNHKTIAMTLRYMGLDRIPKSGK